MLLAYCKTIFQGFASTVRRRLASKLASYDQSLLNIPETRVTTLKNGFRIATEDSGLPTATVSLFNTIS
jgi:processing peptidase subunit beta